MSRPLPERSVLIAEVLAEDIVAQWGTSWVVAVSPLLPLPALLLKVLAARTGRPVRLWEEVKELPGPDMVVVLEESEGLEALDTYERLLQLLELPEAERPLLLLWGTRLRVLFDQSPLLGLAGYVRLARPEVTDRGSSTVAEVLRDWQAASDEPVMIAVPEATGDWPEWEPGTRELVTWIGPRTPLPAWWRPDNLIVLDQRPGLALTFAGGYEYGPVPRNRDRWLYRARRQLIWAEATGAAAETAPVGFLAEVAQLPQARRLEPLLGPLPVGVTPTPLGPATYAWLTAWLAADGDGPTGELAALMYDGGRSALIVPPLEPGERWEAYDIRRRSLLRDWGPVGSGRLLKNLDAWNHREAKVPADQAQLAQDVLRTWDLRYRGWLGEAPPDRVDLEAAAATLAKLQEAGRDLVESEYLR